MAFAPGKWFIEGMAVGSTSGANGVGPVKRRISSGKENPNTNQEEPEQLSPLSDLAKKVILSGMKRKEISLGKGIRPLVVSDTPFDFLNIQKSPIRVSLKEMLLVEKSGSGKVKFPPTLFQDGTRTAFANNEGRVLSLVETGSKKILWEREKQGTEINGEDISKSPAVSPDGKKLAVVGYGGMVYVLDASTKETLWKTQVEDSIGTSPSFSLDGTRLAVGCDGGQISMLDILQKRAVWGIKLPETVTASPVFSPDGKKLAVVTWDGHRRGHFLRLLDASSGNSAWSVERRIDEGSGSQFVSFSPDGKRLVLGIAGGASGEWLSLLDVDSGGQFWGKAVYDWISSPFLFSPDGKRFGATFWSKNNNLLKFCQFDATNGEMLWNKDIYKGRGFASSAVASPDGIKLLLAVGDEAKHDEKLYLLNLKEADQQPVPHLAGSDHAMIDLGKTEPALVRQLLGDVAI